MVGVTAFMACLLPGAARRWWRGIRAPLEGACLTGSGSLACLGLLTALLILAGCGPDGLPPIRNQTQSSQARDYFPFAPKGVVLRWAFGTDITIEIPDCDAPTGCDEGFEAAIEEGIRHWNFLHQEQNLNLTFVYQSGSSGQDDVSVIWDDGSGSSGFSQAVGVGGLSWVRPNEDPSRLMVMVTRCMGCADQRPRSVESIRGTATHEWGHLLGLYSHSFDPVDLMYASRRVGNLSRRDKATVRYLYTLAPDLDLSSLAPNSDGAPWQIRTRHGDDTRSHDIVFTP